MATTDLKISQMPKTASPKPEAIIPIVQDGLNMVVSIGSLGADEVEVNDTGTAPTNPNAEVWVDLKNNPTNTIKVVEDTEDTTKVYARKKDTWVETITKQEFDSIKALITTLQNDKANKSDLNNYATKAELGLINTVLDEING